MKAAPWPIAVSRPPTCSMFLLPFKVHHLITAKLPRCNMSFVPMMWLAVKCSVMVCSVNSPPLLLLIVGSFQSKIRYSFAGNGRRRLSLLGRPVLSTREILQFHCAAVTFLIGSTIVRKLKYSSPIFCKAASKIRKKLLHRVRTSQ